MKTKTGCGVPLGLSLLLGSQVSSFTPQVSSTVSRGSKKCDFSTQTCVRRRGRPACNAVVMVQQAEPFTAADSKLASKGVESRGLQLEISGQQSNTNVDVLPPTSQSRVRFANNNRRVDAGARAQVKAMYQAAQRELRAGRSRQCIDILRKSLLIDKTDSHSWLLLGRTVVRIGDPEEARRIFKDAANACPRSVHVLQAWAVMEQKHGSIESARQLFARANEVDPGNAYVCHAWGLMEQREHNTEKARELFNAAFDRKPQAQVCTALADLEAAGGKMDVARSVLKKGVAACEDKSHVYMAWARLEEQAGNVVHAEELLTEALATAVNPNSAQNIASCVKVHIARAQLEVRRGNTEKATELLAAAADLPHQDAQLFNMWAMLELRQDHLSKALEIIQAARVRFPGEQSLLQTEGTIEEKRGNRTKAAELYRASTQLRPTAPAYVAWALLEDKNAEDNTPEEIKTEAVRGTVKGRDAHVAAASKLRASARRLFEKGIVADPKHGPLYNAYGSMEARLGNVEAARAVFKRGIAAHCTDMASVWHGLGTLELKNGNTQAARQQFSRGLEEATANEDISFLSHSLGALELHAHNAIDALAAFTEGLRRCPNNSLLMLGAALAEAKLGCLSRARAFFKRAIRADTTHAHAWQAWGVLEAREGNVEAARNLFKGGIKAVPCHSALWQAYGLLEVTAGMTDRARSLFQEGIKKCRGHTSIVRLQQAWVCLEVRAGDIEKARQLIHSALQEEPHHGACWTVYAAIEERANDLVKARKVYELGLRADPAHGPLYRCYGAMEAAQGNYAKARELYEKGLQVDPYQPQLYHKYAELEAMVGNIEGLSKLNRKAQAIFSRDSTRPGSSSALRRMNNSIESYLDCMVMTNDAHMLEIADDTTSTSTSTNTEKEDNQSAQLVD